MESATPKKNHHSWAGKDFCDEHQEIFIWQPISVICLCTSPKVTVKFKEKKLGRYSHHLLMQVDSWTVTRLCHTSYSQLAEWKEKAASVFLKRTVTFFGYKKTKELSILLNKTSTRILLCVCEYVFYFQEKSTASKRKVVQSKKEKFTNKSSQYLKDRAAEIYLHVFRV